MTKLGAAWDFQQKQIARLMKESFQQLSRRPPRERLAVPPELRGLNLFMCCRRGENGGIEVTVEAQRRHLFVFVESSTDGFEILPDGKIIPLYPEAVED